MTERNENMTPTEIRTAQSALVAWFDANPGHRDPPDYAAKDCDGKTGPRTARAVKAFQLASGLDCDGVVGPKTLSALAGHAPTDPPPASMVLSWEPTGVVGNGLRVDALLDYNRAILEAVCGLGADDHPLGRRAAYSALLGPGADLNGSSCGMSSRGKFRLLGASLSAVAGRYVIGAAVANIVTFGRVYGAWRGGATANLPGAGSTIVMGQNPPVPRRDADPARWDAWLAEWGGVEHVDNVIDVEAGVTHCISGGQGAGGHDIARVERRLYVNGRDLWCQPANQSNRGRKVLGFVDLGAALEKGAFPGEIVVPRRV